jgi:hypothetical protein
MWMSLYRDPDLEKYKKSMQYIFDGWVLIRTAVTMAGPSTYVGTKQELGTAVDRYYESNPTLQPWEFLYMYPLLKENGFSDEVVDDVFSYFEREATLLEMCAAYRQHA